MYFEDLNTKEYEILDYLGGNSLFRAYLARQVNLNRYVAIRHVGIDAAEGHPRFGNELAAYALLRHPQHSAGARCWRSEHRGALWALFGAGVYSR